MSKRKKDIRNKFRMDVFKRDNFCCKWCSGKFKTELLDAHHITDRNEMPNGGYAKENGITLCPDCHMLAEEFHISGGKDWIKDMHPDDLYKLINSSYELAYKKSELL